MLGLCPYNAGTRFSLMYAAMIYSTIEKKSTEIDLIYL